MSSEFDLWLLGVCLSNTSGGFASPDKHTPKLNFALKRAVAGGA